VFLSSASAERSREERTYRKDYPVMPNAELKRFCSVKLTFLFQSWVCGQRHSMNVKHANPTIFESTLRHKKVHLSRDSPFVKC